MLWANTTVNAFGGGGGEIGWLARIRLAVLSRAGDLEGLAAAAWQDGGRTSARVAVVVVVAIGVQ